MIRLHRFRLALLVVTLLSLMAAACTPATPSAPASAAKTAGSGQSAAAPVAEPAKPAAPPAATTAAVAAAAPTAAAASAPAKPAQAATVLVGRSGEDPGGQLAYDIARSEGYFAEQAIEIKEVQVRGAPLILQALIADQANVGFLSLSTALQGRENGRNIKLGAAVQKTNNWTPIVSVKFLAKKGIDPAAFAKLPPRERFAALKGTTWAVNAAGGLYERATAYVVSQFGLDPERDIQIIPLDQVNQIAGVKDGSVNVWLASPPNNVLLVESGDAVELLTLDEMIREVPAAANARSAEVIINDDWAQKNADIARRFFAAYQKGATFVVQKPVDEIIRSLAKSYPDLQAERLASTVKSNKENTPPDSRHTAAEIQAQIDFSLVTGNIKQKFSVDEAYTDAYLPKP